MKKVILRPNIFKVVIDFNGILNDLGISNAKSLGNRINCTFIFTPFV